MPLLMVSCSSNRIECPRFSSVQTKKINVRRAVHFKKRPKANVKELTKEMIVFTTGCPVY